MAFKIRRLSNQNSNFYKKIVVKTAAALSVPAMSCSVYADGGVTFTDIANQAGSAINYQRTPSASNAIWEAIKLQDVYGAADVPFTPTKPRGIPGVAIFDADQDGDSDIYVTNGPGSANSLYANQYAQTGVVSFEDVSSAAGVEATDQDSTGVCFGDIDNDGDADLYVLGNSEPNRLFENQGDGRFIDITAHSGMGAGSNASSTCSFGDINNDGLLDLVIANLFDNLDHRIPIVSLDFDQLLQDDQLFINTGDNVFVESESSGIQTVPGISWSIALVDYDLDGDVDLFTAHDQGARSPAQSGGRDAGILRLHRNDGDGSFVDVSTDVAGGRFGAWMSLAFGDLNSDGFMDVFGSNVGDYFAQAVIPLIDFLPARGEWESGWFLGNEDRAFDFPGVGDLQATPFGWGGDVVDYDNDGDMDIIYHGGWENGPFVDASNPGAILVNDGHANFGRDAVALAASTDHARRTVHGVAVGDLNNDGFADVVSVSNADWPEAAPLVPYFEDVATLFGGPFDDAAFFMPTFSPLNPEDLFQGFTWNGIELVDGSLSIEMNSGGNGNAGVGVKLMGSVGMVTGGTVNRDGIGAVVSVRPVDAAASMKPVLSGGSHASSHSLTLNFGLGQAEKGMVEVLWPGGVRNRLYNVRANERVVIPEIPCSFDDTSLEFPQYKRCVTTALEELEDAGAITPRFSKRLFSSAMRAFGRPSLHPSGNRVTFEDLSDLIEFSHTTSGGEGHGGVAWLDYDADDDQDLFFTNGFGHNNALFRNNGDGTFTDVSEAAGLENGLGNSGALAGDIDNDGYPDLFLTTAGGLFTPVLSPVKLYHNNGDGTFSDITEGSGITDILTSWGAAFGDANGDGYLDLVVTTPNSVLEQREDKNRFFLNNGDLTFTDVSEETGFANYLGGCLAAFTDYDLDGDQDLLYASCNEIDISVVPINLYRNDGNMQFTDVTVEAGLSGPLGAWMGFAIGDYDNDGDQDFFSTNLGNFPGLTVLPVLFENNGDGTFSDVTQAAGVLDNIFGWGATFTDVNNDGYVDLFYVGSFPFEPFFFNGPLASPGLLYINNGDKTFANRDNWFGVDLSEQFTTGLAAADYDNDGFSDMAIVSGSLTADGSLAGERIPGKPLLMRNEGNDNRWITIKTVGTESNRGGVGARVVVKHNDVVQTKEVRAGSSFLSTESPWLTFGLGAAPKGDSVRLIEIHWPSGHVDFIRNVPANQTITAVEGQGLVGRHHSD